MQGSEIGGPTDEIFFNEFVVLNTRDEVLVWLPVWSEVQIVCIWSS